MAITMKDLRRVLKTYDKGVLSRGAHEVDSGAYCALEAVSIAKATKGDRLGVKRSPEELADDFTDDPFTLNMPDLRNLNDARWSNDKARTKAMLPVIVAVSNWARWGPERRGRWEVAVAIGVVNRIVSRLPALHKGTASRCRKASKLTEAAFEALSARDEYQPFSSAFEASAFEAANHAQMACDYGVTHAGEAADYAARAHGDDAPLIELCRIMISAAKR